MCSVLKQTFKMATKTSTRTATTWTEATSKAAKTATKTTTTWTEDGLKKSEYVVKTSTTGGKVELVHIKGPKWNQTGTSLSCNATVNETSYVIQKRLTESIPSNIHAREMGNSDQNVRRGVISPDTKEEAQMLTVANVNCHERNGSTILTAKGVPHMTEERDQQTALAIAGVTKMTVGDADLQKGLDHKRREFRAAVIKDIIGTTHIQINATFNYRTEELNKCIERILLFLQDLMHNKYFKDVVIFAAKEVTKVCLNNIMPGSRCVLNLAEGIYNIYIGETKTGVKYIFFAAGMTATGDIPIFPSGMDIQFLSKLELDTPTDVYVATGDIDNVIFVDATYNANKNTKQQFRWIKRHSTLFNDSKWRWRK